ncbi:rubredoxin-like domain-containing protein [Halorientalis brevis]|uniref:Rubredoxin-like domain-containing protein n=1 Tax=Halorientalis brevis TaxID=1126241 RepID=A0ABD6C962_9EURY|nr:hypothetical protein [Halorientalis brevis]
MSGRGETPAEEGEHDAEKAAESISFGEVVYNDDGNVLGEIRGMEEAGFFVTTRQGVEGLSIEHARSGHEFGEAELVWRCTVCGEMGEIDGGLPATCPNCGTEKEDLGYWTED